MRAHMQCACARRLLLRALRAWRTPSVALTCHETPRTYAPSHEVVYKQAVAASDAFLGLGGKDPSSACCEELLVRVRLPEAASAAGAGRPCL